MVKWFVYQINPGMHKLTGEIDEIDLDGPLSCSFPLLRVVLVVNVTFCT